MNEKNIVSIDAVIDRIKIRGYIDCNEYDGYMENYEYDNILYYLEKYNNLQSKIDKAIEYIEKYLEDHIIEDQPDEQSIFYDEKGRYIPNAKEQLLDILKEDK